jgi:hypothetical protein
LAGYYAERLEKAKEKGHTNTFRHYWVQEICRRGGVVHHEAELRVSSEQICMTRYSMIWWLWECVHFHFETEHTPGNSIEKILSHAVTPVLTVPEFIPKKR